MIIHYLEIIEQLTEEEAVIKQPMKIILEVADRTEARAKLAIYEPLFEGRTYTKFQHIHDHGDDPQPCILEDLSLTNEELDAQPQ